MLFGTERLESTVSIQYHYLLHAGRIGHAYPGIVQCLHRFGRNRSFRIATRRILLGKRVGICLLILVASWLFVGIFRRMGYQNSLITRLLRL